MGDLRKEGIQERDIEWHKHTQRVEWKRWWQHKIELSEPFGMRLVEQYPQLWPWKPEVETW